MPGFCQRIRVIPKKPAFYLQTPQDPESRQEAAGLSPEPSQLSKEGDPHLTVGSFYYKNTDFKAECDEGRPPVPLPLQKLPSHPLPWRPSTIYIYLEYI